MANFSNLLSRWKEVIIITFIVKLLLLSIPAINNPYLSNLFYPWVRWDGPHYIDLAKNWYQKGGEQSLWIVFYPLYPIMIKIFNFFVNDFASSAVIVSILFSFSASILLFELTLVDFNKKVSLMSVWFLNIFPTSYFLQASYTESLYLSISLLTVYLFRKKLYFPAGTTGLLSSMTRINGIILIPLLLIEEKISKKNLLALVSILLGLLSYLSINYFTFGQFFYFIYPLSSNWHKRFEWPWIGLNNLISSIPNYNNPLFYAYATEVSAVVLTFFLSIYIFLKIRKSYAIYTFLNLLLILSTSFVVSTPRYILILFPLFIAFANISKSNKIIFALISLLFLILLIFFSVLYTQGRWAF